MMMGLELILLPLLAGGFAYALGWRPQFLQNGLAQGGQNSVEILKSRYASGQITREEYDQMRRDLAG
jgi:uncharacterized membrane protein